MFENTPDIIKQISLGEDSVLELKTVKFSGNKTTGPRQKQPSVFLLKTSSLFCRYLDLVENSWAI